MLTAHIPQTLLHEERMGRCVVCSCSEHDPCPGGCAWMNHAATVCSRCALNLLIVLEPDPPTPAELAALEHAQEKTPKHQPAGRRG